jgi:conjugative transfer signal peptidase TraF
VACTPEYRVVRSRAFVLAAATVALGAQVVGAAYSPKLLLWNASASAPRGLYALHAARPFYVGELVAVTPPVRLAAYLAKRGYLPLDVPLVKYIAARSGQSVCRLNRIVTIDGVGVATARERDHLGRSLPVWRGCRRLNSGDVFLLNRDAPASFDGRYFGVLSVASITARATPLWTEKQP